VFSFGGDGGWEINQAKINNKTMPTCFFPFWLKTIICLYANFCQLAFGTVWANVFQIDGPMQFYVLSSNTVPCHLILITLTCCYVAAPFSVIITIFVPKHKYKQSFDEKCVPKYKSVFKLQHT